MTEVQSYWNEIKVVAGAIKSTQDSRFCTWLVGLKNRLIAAAISGSVKQ